MCVGVQMRRCWEGSEDNLREWVMWIVCGKSTSSRRNHQVKTKPYGRWRANLRNNQETGVIEAEQGGKIRIRPGWRGGWGWCPNHRGHCRSRNWNFFLVTWGQFESCGWGKKEIWLMFLKAHSSCWVKNCLEGRKSESQELLSSPSARQWWLGTGWQWRRCWEVMEFWICSEDWAQWICWKIECGYGKLKGAEGNTKVLVLSNWKEEVAMNWAGEDRGWRRMFKGK